MARWPATISTTLAAIAETILAAMERNNKAYNIVAKVMGRSRKAEMAKEVSAWLVWNAVATFKIGGYVG